MIKHFSLIEDSFFYFSLKYTCISMVIKLIGYAVIAYVKWQWNVISFNSCFVLEFFFFNILDSFFSSFYSTFFFFSLCYGLIQVGESVVLWKCVKCTLSGKLLKQWKKKTRSIEPAAFSNLEKKYLKPS